MLKYVGTRSNILPMYSLDNKTTQKTEKENLKKFGSLAKYSFAQDAELTCQ